MSSHLFKGGRRKRKFKAFESAYKEKHQDYEKSCQLGYVDIATQDEMLTRKINKAEEDARILVAEMNCLGMTENLVLLRTIFQTVHDMEKQRRIFKRMKKLMQDEDCRRNNFVLDNMREHLLWKNFYRMKMLPSKKSRRKMLKKAVQLEKEKDKCGITNTDIDQALDYEAESATDEEEKEESNLFYDWIKGISNTSNKNDVSVFAMLPSTSTDNSDDVDKSISERLNRLKIDRD